MPPEYLQTALRYSLSIEGVTSAVVGAYTVEEVLQNVEWAKHYEPCSAQEQTQLGEEGRRMAAEWGPRFGPAA